jgi:hypothetical protein
LWLDTEWRLDEIEFDQLAGQILAVIPQDRAIHFRDLADSLDEVPWPILKVCRILAKRGTLVEGTGDLDGCFRKTA